MLERAEVWAEKCQLQRLAGEKEVAGSEEERAGRRVRTLDARSGVEIDA